jgi:hypothetical protein
MAFVTVIADDLGPPKVRKQGEQRFVARPIGYDEETRTNYSLFVTLDPRPGGDWELSFFILEYDGAGNEQHVHWTREHLARLLSKEEREAVVGAVRAATRLLLSEVRPEKVYMCTVEPHLPARAMAKYAAIIEEFLVLGYRVTPAPVHHGISMWIMDRLGTME